MPCHSDCAVPPEDDCRTQCQDVKVMPGGDLDEFDKIANAAFSAFVMTADLSLLEERLRKEKTIPVALIDSAVMEYRKFMSLLANGHRNLAMISQIVDEVWHAHILHTLDYAEFCQRTIGSGKFIHHQPNSDKAPIPMGERARFIEIYQATYGSLPPVWSGKKITGCTVN